MKLDRRKKSILIMVIIPIPIIVYIAMQLIYDFPIPEYVGGAAMVIGVILIFLLTLKTHFFTSYLNRGFQLIWLKKQKITEVEKPSVVEKAKSAISGLIIEQKIRILNRKYRKKERKNDNKI